MLVGAGVIFSTEEGRPRGALYIGFRSSRCAEAPDVGMTQSGMKGGGAGVQVHGGDSKQGEEIRSYRQLPPPTPFSGACGWRSGSCRGCPDVQHCVQIGREETEASGQGAHLGGRLESIEREAEGGGQ